jgi:hypothetical protein
MPAPKGVVVPTLEEAVVPAPKEVVVLTPEEVVVPAPEVISSPYARHMLISSRIL